MTTVSIIMPAFNAEAHIETAIMSVCDQTFSDWELHVIDDHSKDRTAEIVKSFHDSRIFLHSKMTNKGVAHSRNYGLTIAKGRYIAFLDSDDIWKPEKLRFQLENMKKNNLSLCYSAYEVIDTSGEKITGFVKVPKKITYRKLLKNTIIGCLTVVIDTKKTGPIQMPLLEGAEDTATWLAILKQGHRAEGVLTSLAYYRKGNTSLSSNKLTMAKHIWTVYRKEQQLSLLQSIWNMPFYFYNGFFKHIKTGGRLSSLTLTQKKVDMTFDKEQKL
ncbi:glycosyltransferase family 2 protein [Listeria fleischmannii]|jgi:teichuronic acid biosynthesis glycosyltransferase TuaG|uniref:Glycosyltransferase n=1 Tax=Listeria fleischmannii TaxID=1069827 RepID=A0A841YHV2_9LIST|nr:glycosyltransferase family 2 protein [Listeria fleischmannii]EIA20271.1 family 2 glycosyl transferase [Listeria fleischmannii subsp. coloradonensis]MBC1399869.1 glycosyltransferase [Listeria fleischmannii]MBC1419453.1 glycosyltransferase [Listeria fleischmannii]MBC1428178.1 glycosyltransferase [Listeria fleischmannii]STY34539.1 Hyaluronan synthase [Listeria fleischmannii subsp. coloradonensis]